MRTGLIDDMMMALPPLQGERHVVMPGEQSVKDIIAEVWAAHQEFSADYDCLPDFFIGKDLLQTLFHFCQDNLPYIMESEHLQTTRSPTAILALADHWGCDCKHYAGWIGGVIDACNRAGYTNYDWCYRFASYDPWNSTKEHVYIVVNDHGREIWIDPAPIENDDGTFTGRYFNDRKVIPFYQTDYTPKKSKMSIQRIRGIYSGYAMMGYIQDAYSVQADPYDYSSGYGGINRLERDINTSSFDLIAPAPAPTITYDPAPTIYYDPWYVPASEPETPLPSYPDAPLFDPLASEQKLETVTRPVITDYPEVTGEPIYMLPTVEREIQLTDRESIDSAIRVNFDFMEFVRSNPWQTALIAGGIVAAGYYLFFAGKKKRA